MAPAGDDGMAVDMAVGITLANEEEEVKEEEEDEEARAEADEENDGGASAVDEKLSTPASRECGGAVDEEAPFT